MVTTLLNTVINLSANEQNQLEMQVSDKQNLTYTI